MTTYLKYILLCYIYCCASGFTVSTPEHRKTKPFVVYPNQLKSERDLELCDAHAACNIIHRRFWLPPMVERLCRCPNRYVCSSDWSHHDNLTMALDNRSQLKFCDKVNTLPKCQPKKVALTTITENPFYNEVSRNFNKYVGQVGHIKSKRIATAHCNCQQPHYWKLKVNGTRVDENTGQIHQGYYCSKLKKCQPLEFCGYIRSDHKSTSYRCSCPNEHMCLSRTKTLYQVNELLFEGYANKAFCVPNLNAYSRQRRRNIHRY